MCVCAQLLQSCQTLCDPLSCSLSGSSVHGILCSEGWPCPPPRNLPNQDWTHVSCIAGRFFTTKPPGKPYHLHIATHKLEIPVNLILQKYVFPNERCKLLPKGEKKEFLKYFRGEIIKISVIFITYMVICQLSKMCNFWNVICFPSLRKLLPKFALIVLCPGSAPALEFHPSPSPGPHGRRLNKARAVRTQPDMTKPWTPGQSEFCFPETTGAEEWAFIQSMALPHMGDTALVESPCTCEPHLLLRVGTGLNFTVLAHVTVPCKLGCVDMKG